MKRTFLALIFLLIYGSAWAGINCDQSTLQTAINNAASGSTITCNAGTWTWAGVSLNKDLDLIGAGSSQTIINFDDSVADAITVSVSPPGRFRISGFNFNDTASVGGRNVAINITGHSNGWRIDHNKFTQNLSYVSSDSIYAWSPAYGLIDNNTWTDCGQENINIFSDGQANELSPWTQTLLQVAGTTNAVYIEDNTWNLGNVRDWGSWHAVTSGRGARYVARNNIINMNGAGYVGMFDVHGYCGASYEWSGGHTFEIYDNIINVNHPDASGIFAALRGGSGLVYNNTFNVIQGSALTNYLTDNRTEPGYGCYIDCSTPGSCTYPMIYQIGYQDPAYIYGNTGLGGTWVNGTGATWYYIQQDRDYCLHNPSTSCGSFGAWSYSPLIHPHPLQNLPSTYTITSNPGSNGSLSCIPSSGSSGFSSTCTATPNTGYYTSSMSVSPSRCGGTGWLWSSGNTINGTVGANCTVSSSFTVIPAGVLIFPYEKNQTVVVGWNAVTNVPIDHYEVDVVRDDGTVTVFPTANTQLTVIEPRSGFFTVKVRAIGTSGTPGSFCFSTDSSCSTINGTAGAWKIEWRPVAPTGPITVTPR